MVVGFLGIDPEMGKDSGVGEIEAGIDDGDDGCAGEEAAGFERFQGLGAHDGGPAEGARGFGAARQAEILEGIRGRNLHQ